MKKIISIAAPMFGGLMGADSLAGLIVMRLGWSLQLKSGLFPLVLFLLLTVVYMASLWVVSLAEDIVTLVTLVPVCMFSYQICSANVPTHLPLMIISIGVGLLFALFLFRLIQRIQKGNLRATFSLLHFFLGLWALVGAIAGHYDKYITVKEVPSPDQSYIVTVQDYAIHIDRTDIRIEVFENCGGSVLIFEYRPNASHWIGSVDSNDPLSVEWMNDRLLRVNGEYHTIEP